MCQTEDGVPWDFQPQAQVLIPPQTLPYTFLPPLALIRALF